MRTILYYPQIEIPNGDWLKQAILYWDNVGSIVPKSYDEWADQAQKERYGTDIKYLREENVFFPFNPDTLIGSGEEPTFVDEFLNTILSEKFQRKLPPKDQRNPDTDFYKGQINSDIYKEKLTGPMFNILEQEFLAKENDNDSYKFEANTYHLYMTLLAKYLARVHMVRALGTGKDQITVTGTNQEHKIFSDFSYNALTDTEKTVSLSFFLKNTLPVPGKDVSFQRILQFKNAHKQQLVDFQQKIDELEAALRKSNDVREINNELSKFKNQIESNTNRLEKDMRAFSIETKLSSLQTLLKAAPGGLTIALAGLAAGVTAVGAIPLTTIALIGGVSAAIEVSLHLFKSSNAREALFDKNAFSYIYFTKKEL